MLEPIQVGEGALQGRGHGHKGGRDHDLKEKAGKGREAGALAGPHSGGAMRRCGWRKGQQERCRRKGGREARVAPALGTNNQNVGVACNCRAGWTWRGPLTSAMTQPRRRVLLRWGGGGYMGLQQLPPKHANMGSRPAPNTTGTGPPRAPVCDPPLGHAQQEGAEAEGSAQALSEACSLSVSSLSVINFPSQAGLHPSEHHAPAPNLAPLRWTWMRWTGS